MARSTHSVVILLASISSLAGFVGSTSVLGNVEVFGPVKLCDCDCPNTFYYKTQNAAAYKNSENDCKNNFGKDAHLVYVETLPENVNVTDFFDDDDSGTTYWTGGLYNVVNERFEWGNGVPFDESWCPWAPGHPQHKTSSTVVLVSHIRGVGLQFSTSFNTVSLRAVCEFQV